MDAAALALAQNSASTTMNNNSNVNSYTSVGSTFQNVNNKNEEKSSDDSISLFSLDDSERKLSMKLLDHLRKSSECIVGLVDTMDKQ
eukprot:gene20752-26907_t